MNFQQLPTSNPRQQRIPEKLDPLERIIPLLVKIGLYLILGVVFFQALDYYAEIRPNASAPWLLVILHNGIFLFIHEGGHGLFWFFGRTLKTLGGSFWEVMFPLLSFVIAVRKRSLVVAPFALFWVGFSLMSVSHYMRDAPLRQLRLITRDKSGHDWHNLLVHWNMMQYVETMSDTTFFTGVIVCVNAVVAGFVLAGYRYFRPKLDRPKFATDPDVVA